MLVWMYRQFCAFYALYALFELLRQNDVKSHDLESGM